MEPAETTTDKRMRLRYQGVCRLCGVELAARQEAIYERPSKTARCVERTAERHLAGVKPGLRVVRLDHQDCSVESTAEAEEVVRQVESLIGTPWTGPTSSMARGR